MKYFKRNLTRLNVLFLILFIIVTSSSCKKESDEAKQAAIDRGLIEQYVAEHSLEGKYTLSGMYFIILEKGDGTYPAQDAVIQVTYKGYLLDGTVFEENHIPLISLANLIPGWQEGIRLIDKGGTIQLIIPSGLAYGDDYSDNIPANSVLVFEITLHDFE